MRQVPSLEVARTLGAVAMVGSARPTLQLPCPPISIDTRTLLPGQWYVAITGDRFDGHDFVPEALQKGAPVIIHSKDFGYTSGWKDCLFLRVEDTRRALRGLGRLAREQWGKAIIAVTGSMGKTTTRQFANTLFAQKFSVFQSPGNWNNEIGLPLSLMRLTEEHDVGVLELAMNHSGEIGRLAATCLPDIALITNVAEVHLEFFRNLNEIAAAKGEILDHMRPGGTFAFNLDDPKVAALAQQHPGKRLSFGFCPDADVRITRCVMESLSSMRLTLELEGEQIRTELPFAGRHLAYNVAGAVSLGLVYGLSLENLQAGVDALKPSPMRGSVLQLNTGERDPLTIWDHSYNSNPRAVQAVLDTIRELKGFRRKILVLGEMLELGERSPELHRQVGRAVTSTDANLLVAVGEGAGGLLEGARADGFAADRARHFEDMCGAVQFLTGEVRGGDLILVKGSRGIGLDRIIDKLKEIFPT